MVRDLGISGQALRDHLNDLPNLMLMVSDGLKNMPNAADAGKAAMDTIGRGGKEILPFLKQGSDAIRDSIDWHKKYGGVVTEAQAESAHAWEVAVTRIESAWDRLEQIFIEPIRDTLRPYLDALVDWFERNQPYLEDIAKQIAVVVVEAIEAIIHIMQSLLPILAGVSDAIADFFQMLADATGVEAFDHLAQGARDASAAIVNMGTALNDLKLPDASGFVSQMQAAATAARDTTGRGGAGGSFDSDDSPSTATASGGGTYNVNVNVNATLDPNETADAIGRKINPEIARLLKSGQVRFDSAATVAKVRRGLGNG